MNTLSNTFRVLILGCLAFALAACGGGGGGDGGNGGAPPPPPAATNNLTATGMQVVTADPRIGYPLDVSVSLMANETTNNVSVSLFAVQKDQATSSSDPTQIPLGTQTIDQVDAGGSTHDIKVNIASSVAAPGQYYITAVVDPADLVPETTKDDNTFSIETTIGAPATNVFLSDVTLDRSSLEISTTPYNQEVTGAAGDVYNADASATITVGADGLAASDKINIEAFATLRMTRTDLGTTHDVPLYLWNSAANRYIDAYGVDPTGQTTATSVEWLPLGEFAPQLVTQTSDETALDPLNNDSALLNFYFPGKLGSVLEYAMRYQNLPTTLSTEPTIPPPDLTDQAISDLKAFLKSLPSGAIGDESEAMAVMNFAICVDIRPAANTIVDSDTSDNEKCSPIAITLPPLPPSPPPPVVAGITPVFTNATNPLELSHGYKTKAGGSMFSFGLDFGNSVSADERGYKEDEHAAIPITVFGLKGDYMKIAVSAQLVPDYPGKPETETTHFTVEERHLGQLIDSVYSVPPGSDPNVKPLEVKFVAYSKDFPDPPKEALMWLGPVPLSVGASVEGDFGVDFGLALSDEYPDGYRMSIGQGGPFASVEALVYAAVGSKVGGFAAGIEGVLSLLDEKINFGNDVDIAVIEHAEANSPVEFTITQGPKITNVFTGPQGKINLFAVYSVPAIGKCKVGPIKIPCPVFKKIKVTQNLWSSKSLFEFEDVLYQADNLQLDVVIPPGQQPVYFKP